MTKPLLPRIRPLSREWNETVQRYLKIGEAKGFFRSVLENDLAGALSLATDEDYKILPMLVVNLYIILPTNAWGSKKNVIEWSIKKRDERGQESLPFPEEKRR